MFSHPVASDDEVFIASPQFTIFLKRVNCKFQVEESKSDVWLSNKPNHDNRACDPLTTPKRAQIE